MHVYRSASQRGFVSIYSVFFFSLLCYALAPANHVMFAWAAQLGLGFSSVAVRSFFDTCTWFSFSFFLFACAQSNVCVFRGGRAFVCSVVSVYTTGHSLARWGDCTCGGR